MTVRSRESAAARRSGSRSVTPAARSSGGNANRGINGLFLLLAIVGSLHALSMIGVETWRSVVGQQEVTRLQNDIAALELEIGGLQAVVDHARDDRYREQLARCLGFIYPNETRVITLLEPGSEPLLSGPLCQ